MMSKYIYHISTLVALLAALCSCSQEQDALLADEVILNLVPSINSGASVTRAPIVFAGSTLTPSTGTSMNFGLWICPYENSYEAYSAGMANMRCNYDISTVPARWTFYYAGEAHSMLSVKPKGSTDNDDIYIYAYFPYSSASASPEAIPVYSGKDELIYAPRVHVQAGTAKSQTDVPLNFRHAMACIEFSVIPAHTHINLRINTVTITDSDTDNPILPASSEFNIITESYNNAGMQYCTSIVATEVQKYLPAYNAVTANMTPAKVYIPVIPFSGYKDKRFTVSFNISNKICNFPLPAIDPDENGCMNFKQGYKYVYNLVLANEMIFQSGSIVQTDWSDGPDTQFDI